MNHTKSTVLPVKIKGVCVVFEPAYDVHIPKDVIQVPLELGKLLGGCPVYLLTRPNVCQKTLEQHIKVIYLGDPIDHNNKAFLNQKDEDLICSHVWQAEACIQAAKYADILMLFPHYANHAKCAWIFWFACVLKGRLGKVFVKLDAKPDQFDQKDQNHGLAGKLKSFKTWLKYLPIKAISVEHERAFADFTRLHTPLKSKCFIVKNCPPQAEVIAFERGSDLNHKDKQNIFLTVGRLGSYQKATDVLLSAWILAASHCPGWKLKLIGACDQIFYEEWSQKLKSADLARTVEWLDPVHDRTLLWEIYRQAKVFIFPSRFEGASLALGEASRAGCAVIATPVGDVPELLENLDPGLVPVDNSKVLAEKMILFASNEAVCNRQRSVLKQRIRERQWATQLSPLSNRLHPC